MEMKVKEALDQLDAVCLGAEGVSPQQRNRVRETINALRMLCTYLAFDIEATRRENTALRSLIQQTKNKKRKPKQ
ncbi:MAG: hypothetical protein K8R92_04260 [Planctomycetes bacterium]|nr:hypothetical protein [Planctomycetota bacterium]